MASKTLGSQLDEDSVEMNRNLILSYMLRKLRTTAAEELYLRAGVNFCFPNSIVGTLTHRCNGRCGYCPFWQSAAQPEMTLEQWKSALLSLRELVGAYLIAFSGGEPFLVPWFIELVEFCREHGIAWHAITNGTGLTPELVPRIVAARPANLDISVDSADPKVHDAVRGAKGSFERIDRGMALLRTEMVRQGASFTVRIKPTVHRLNYRTLPELVQWSRRVGASSIDFSPVRPIADEFWTQAVKDRLWIPTHELDTLSKVTTALLELRRTERIIETDERRLLSWPAHFRGARIAPAVMPCRVGLRDYHILPNGDVEVCWMHATIGNVKDASARELWTGERAKQLRQQTVRCNRFGKSECANSCLAHRSLKQELQRGLRVLRRIA